MTGDYKGKKNICRELSLLLKFTRLHILIMTMITVNFVARSLWSANQSALIEVTQQTISIVGFVQAATKILNINLIGSELSFLFPFQNHSTIPYISQLVPLVINRAVFHRQAAAADTTGN